MWDIQDQTEKLINSIYFYPFISYFIFELITQIYFEKAFVKGYIYIAVYLVTLSNLEVFQTKLIVL